MFNRTGRLSYFLASLTESFIAIAVGAGSASLAFTSLSPEAAQNVQAGLFFFAVPILLLFTFRRHIKRLHDINRSGSYALLLFVPLVNVYWAFKLHFARGTKGENDFGYPESAEELGAQKRRALVTGIAIVAALTLLAFAAYPRIVEEGNQAEYERSKHPVPVAVAKRSAKRKMKVQVPAAEIVRKKALSGEEKNALAQRADRPCDADLNYMIGKVMLKRGNYDRLEDFYNGFRRQCGEFLELRWMVYKGAKTQGDFRQAERLVSSLIIDFPNDHDYFGWRGLLYQRYELWGKAAADFEAAIRLAPRLQGLPLNLVAAYSKQGKPCRALKSLNRYSRTYPSVARKASFRKTERQLISKCPQTY